MAFGYEMHVETNDKLALLELDLKDLFAFQFVEENRSTMIGKYVYPSLLAANLNALWSLQQTYG